jgi:RPE1 domain-containing protein
MAYRALMKPFYKEEFFGGMERKAGMHLRVLEDLSTTLTLKLPLEKEF